MAANDPITVSTVQSGDTTRLKPVVFNELLQVEPDSGAFLAIYNELLMGGKKMTVGQQEFRSNHVWPFEYTATITVGAAAGALVLTVDDSQFFRNGHQGIVKRTNEHIRLTADPPTTTTIACARAIGTTAAQAVVAGDEIIFTIPTVTEQWPRPTPQGRGSESHVDYVGTVQHASAISWHDTFSEKYGITSKALIDRNDKLNWERAQNRYLWLSEPYKDIASDPPHSLYLGGGIRYYGERYFNTTVADALTWKQFNRVLQIMKKFGGARSVTVFTSQNLVAEASMWAKNTGVWRVNDGNRNVGFDRPTFSTTTGLNIRIVEDFVFDETGLDDELLVVNFDYIEAVEYGTIEFIRPSDTLPNGAADLGTGTKMSVMTRAMGIHNKLPVAAVARIKGVKYFKD